MITELNEIIEKLDLREENTIRGYAAILKNINQIEESKNVNIRLWNSIMVKGFIEKYYCGRSIGTLWNVKQRVKNILRAMDNDCEVEIDNELLGSEDLVLLTPKQVLEVVVKLQNPQEQALMVLSYIGLYDSKFSTIRNLKESQINLKDREIVLENGKVVKITTMVANILASAMEQKIGYWNSSKGHSKTFKYNAGTGYLIRGRESNMSTDVIAEISCRNRFKALREYYGFNGLEPIRLKNSGLLYQLALIEAAQDKKFTTNEIKEWLTSFRNGAAINKFMKQKKIFENIFLEEKKYAQMLIENMI